MRGKDISKGEDTGEDAHPLPDLRDLVDTVPAIMSYFDRNLICRFANAYHFGWYGRSPATMVGRHLREIIGETDFEARQPHIERAFRGETSAFEYRVPNHNGTSRVSAIRYVPKRIPGGVDGFYILAFDVASLHDRFQSIFDGTAVGFWMLDVTLARAWIREYGAEGPAAAAAALSRHPSLVRMLLDAMPIIEINHKAGSMFELPVTQATGMRFGTFCPDESLAAFREQLCALAAGNRSFETETTLRTSTGRPVEVLLTCAFPNDDPGQSAIIIGTTDISYRVAKEQELVKTQADLAHALRVATLGEMVVSIAHEVAQPLGAIVTDGAGALRWLRRPEPDLKEVEEALDRMIAECNRASAVIARTKALAMKQDFLKTDCDINELIEETISVVRRQLASHETQLFLDLQSDLPLLSVDRVQIQQVLINLFLNAAQAMLSQSTARHLRVATGLIGSDICITVSDSGPGLGADAEKAFDVFFTTKKSGMGMGLAIAKRIVEAHEGTISVQPGEHHGAIFNIRLPVLPAPPEGQDVQETTRLSG